MKKNNRTFLVAIVALALFAVSVGYALISRTYNFEGTAKIKGNQWVITEPKDEDITVKPEGAQPPTIEVDEDGNVTITYTADLETPGDYYEFVAPIKNDGSVAAKISSVSETEISNPSIEDYVTYTITAEDGSALANKKLAADGGVVNVKVRLVYNEQNNLPEDGFDGVTFKNKLTLVQDK